MTYLDYLPDTAYADLPAAAQAEISATDYAKLQVLATGLSEPKGLPNALSSALAAKVPVAPGPSPSLGNKTSGVHAGWRVAALLSMVSLLSFFLYSAFAKTPVAPLPEVPAPEVIERIVVERDTVQQIIRDTVTLYRTKIEIREIRDTVYLKRDIPVATTPVKIEDSLLASKSLLDGLDWGELTVRGNGELGERE